MLQDLKDSLIMSSYIDSTFEVNYVSFQNVTDFPIPVPPLQC